ncbi:MAG: hypothetical protein H6712_34670 [Myxococcales bacterium]|nr:hypothetical protein [Myxococcales bacterium]MCB9719041.1 hypothetical protein [Myxococcales bacterium]
MSEPPVMQRLGLRYVEWRERRLGASELQVDPHYLDEAEQRALLRIQWRLVGSAALLGTASGLVCALAEVWADEALAGDPYAGWGAEARYWAFLGSVIGVAALLEVALLYLGSLRAVHAIARTAGTPLFVTEADASPGSPMAAALVRAALELPNPPPQGYAIDPLREVSRLRAVAIGLLYKAKVGLSSFLIKLVLRRAAGRAALRAWLPFVGVPVTAFWNGVVAYVVIREARLRAIGPSAARRFGELLQLPEGREQPERAELVWRAVAATIVRTHELHPNVAALMEVLRERMGEAPHDELDDTSRFLERLAVAPEEDRRVALRALAVAAALDGRIDGDERRLVHDAGRASGLELHPRDLARLRRRFVAGRHIDASLLEPLAREPGGAPGGLPSGQAEPSS